jgi:hypothetical protein
MIIKKSRKIISLHYGNMQIKKLYIDEYQIRKRYFKLIKK